jgi:hypothetical protein
MNATAIDLQLTGRVPVIRETGHKAGSESRRRSPTPSIALTEEQAWARAAAARCGFAASEAVVDPGDF